MNEEWDHVVKTYTLLREIVDTLCDVVDAIVHVHNTQYELTLIMSELITANQELNAKIEKLR